MEIREKIDNSLLRQESEKTNIPILELLMKKLSNLSNKNNENYTLLAICPNSENVLKAALRSAKRSNAPILFAATFNQVDRDKGYTGWTHKDLVRIIKEESYKIGYDGPIIICVDHGGPWAKDIQAIERWNLNKAMNWTKRSFEEALLSGFELLHIDPTIDLFSEIIEIEEVVNRTIELISHIENIRRKNKIGKISYEVGTEEVRGGLANLDIFNRFLILLKKGLSKKNLISVWPLFIVAKVGTDLHTTTFNPEISKKVTKISKSYNSFIKGHYTDFVSNPFDYPKSGIGAANVGPEFTALEYEALNKLCKIEVDLLKNNKIAVLSNFKEILHKVVMDSGRWKKWLKEDEKNFECLKEERKEIILKTSCRYVWSNAEVRAAQSILYKNMGVNGIDADSWVLMDIESGMDKYFNSFNLINLNDKLEREITGI